MALSVLEQRLISQLTNQAGIKDAAGAARHLLVQRGHLTASGDLTPDGQRRQDLGNDGRAIDRAVQRSGRKASEYSYDAKSNRATLKRR